jgi:hypothetical protein
MPVTSCCSTCSETAEQQFNESWPPRSWHATARRGQDPPRVCFVMVWLMLTSSTGSCWMRIGAITFEGLDCGVKRAIAVDASGAYLAAAGDEAARRGRRQTIEFVHGDFVEVGGQLPSAAVVVLDRVVCCYPLCEPLLATRHAERCLAFSYPRDLWYVRMAVVGENARRWIARNSFRTFVHPAAAIASIVRGAGFRPGQPPPDVDLVSGCLPQNDLLTVKKMEGRNRTSPIAATTRPATA